MLQLFFFFTEASANQNAEASSNMPRPIRPLGSLCAFMLYIITSTYLDQHDQRGSTETVQERPALREEEHGTTHTGRERRPTGL